MADKLYRFKIDPQKTPGMTADIKWSDFIKGHEQNQTVFGRVVGRITKDKNCDWALWRDELEEVKIEVDLLKRLNTGLTPQEWKVIREKAKKMKPRARKRKSADILPEEMSDDDYNELLALSDKPKKTVRKKSEKIDRDARALAILKKMGYRVK